MVENSKARGGTEEKAGSEGAAGVETLAFDADVARILEIVTHSLYSNRDIFLRELIANAADACEKRRYLALSDSALLPEEGFAVTLEPDAATGTLAIVDNGVGMNRQELIENLGTIAASGTGRFLQQLKEQGTDAKGALSQIGQFGVGFYSAFMVAGEVTVETRRAGEEGPGWRWRSTGGGSFALEPLEAEAPPGTRVVLSLKEDATDYADPARLERLVKTWCDHVAQPIRLRREAGQEPETLNQASALWTRPKGEITDEQAEAFYRDVAHAFDKPWRRLHIKAEGTLEWSALLFIPSERPPALFHPDRRSDLRLYVKRVFITDDCPALLPGWLRFLKGVIDSEDLPLNVSRELLQDSPLLGKIRQAVVKRVLADLVKASEEDAEGYLRFWEGFGPVLKEGLYEDPASREQLLPLLRLRSSAVEGWTSLADYVGRMKPEQEAIYTLSGESLERVRQSPQLEGFRARGLEVLFLTDPVDEFWVTAVTQFQDKPFRSVTRGQSDLARFPPEGEAAAEGEALEGSELGTLTAYFKQTLGEAVKEVRASDRLNESAVCLVAGEGDIDLNLERILKAHGQVERESARVLEVNPRHPVIRALAARLQDKGGDAGAEDICWLLLEEARLLEGELPREPAAFGGRLGRLIERALGGERSA